MAASRDSLCILGQLKVIFQFLFVHSGRRTSTRLSACLAAGATSVRTITVLTCDFLQGRLVATTQCSVSRMDAHSATLSDGFAHLGE